MQSMENIFIQHIHIALPVSELYCVSHNHGVAFFRVFTIKLCRYVISDIAHSFATELCYLVCLHIAHEFRD